MAEGRKTKAMMVAMDEEETSSHALRWALDNLAGSLSSASSSPLLVLNVQPISALAYVPPAAFHAGALAASIYTPPELIQAMQEQQRKISLAILERAKKICAEKGVVAETITEIGDPKEAICDAVEKFKINLLIMGSHNRGALQRVFLGSVSNYCVHHAKCPVLVVKKSE